MFVSAGKRIQMITIAWVQFPAHKTCVCAGHRNLLPARTCNHVTLHHKQREQKAKSGWKKQHVRNGIARSTVFHKLPYCSFNDPHKGTSSGSCSAFCSSDSHLQRFQRSRLFMAQPVSKRACCRKEEQWDGRVWKRKQPKEKLPNSTSNSRIVHQLWQQVLSPMCVMAEWNGYPNETITSVPNVDLRKWNLKLILQAVSWSAPVQCWRQMLARSLWRTRLTIPTAKMAAKRQQGKAKGWGIFILQTSKMSGRRKKVFQFYLIIKKLGFK